jgi:MFS family permease
MIGSTLGNISGYILAACVQDNLGWRWAFYIQSILIGLAILTYFTIPDNVVNLRKMTPIIMDYQKRPKSEKISKRRGFIKVATNFAFLRLCFSVTILYFVVTGI